jgi:hypothetical protein
MRSRLWSEPLLHCWAGFLGLARHRYSTTAWHEHSRRPILIKGIDNDACREMTLKYGVVWIWLGGAAMKRNIGVGDTRRPPLQGRINAFFLCNVRAEWEGMGSMCGTFVVIWLTSICDHFDWIDKAWKLVSMSGPLLREALAWTALVCKSSGEVGGEGDRRCAMARFF